MCLNDILQDEQLALMCYARASSPPVRASWTRRLSLITCALQSFHYPHRPFVWRPGHEQDTH